MRVDRQLSLHEQYHERIRGKNTPGTAWGWKCSLLSENCPKIAMFQHVFSFKKKQLKKSGGGGGISPHDPSRAQPSSSVNTKRLGAAVFKLFF